MIWTNGHGWRMQLICLQPVEIPVRDSEPLELMQRVEQAYVDHFGADPEDKGGWYEPDGWKRVSRVFDRLEPGGDILDVGTGAGQFANCLAFSKVFDSVTTIDPTRFNKYIELSDDITRLDMSIADMDFPTDSFDVVTCMEVLEHLPEEIFLPAIAELRRVCRGQLIITVPYREPEPISKTHVRRFEDPDFARLFPHADFAILRRPRRPWMMIEEWPNSPVKRTATVLASDNEHRADISGLRKELRSSREQIRILRKQVKALQGRKVLRAADWGGRRIRQARQVVEGRVKR